METINEMYDAIHELLKRQENFSEDNFKQFVSVTKDCLRVKNVLIIGVDKDGAYNVSNGDNIGADEMIAKYEEKIIKEYNDFFKLLFTNSFN